MTERAREVAISEGEYEMLKRIYRQGVLGLAFEPATTAAFEVFLHRLCWELYGRVRADEEWPPGARELMWKSP